MESTTDADSRTCFASVGWNATARWRIDSSVGVSGGREAANEPGAHASDMATNNETGAAASQRGDCYTALRCDPPGSVEE